jgi:hypothetical protein
MPQNYPETEGFAYTFARAELTLKGKIYTAITSVEIDQPTEASAVKGTSPAPLSHTEGTMDLGEGTITFSDERERMDFIDDLGDAYRTTLFTLSWVLKGNAGDETKIACQGCRVLSNPISHEEGADALGGDVTFSFLAHTINGKKPH